jgi:hypothetical protein
MKKTFIKAVLCLLMFAFSANSVFAFAFTDISALAQRVAKFSQDASQYVQQNSHFAQFMRYVTEFNNYRNQFESYQRTFERVYRKIDSGYYARNFNVSDWDWTRLDDHLLRVWKTVNQALWDAQVLTVRASRLYDTNPAYRRYADRVIQLGNEKIENMKKEEALSIDLERRGQERRQAIEELRATNEDLAGQDNNGAHLQALNNQILLELAAIQAEANVIERQRMRNSQELQNLNMEMERLISESQANEAEAWDFILNTTTGQ